MSVDLPKTMNVGRVQRLLILIATLALCLVVLCRYELMNGFTVLPGEGYDGVIGTTILEHWFRVLSGNANWAEVNYFFPYKMTIAQTDGYFLIGVAYFPFRFFGIDPFLSTDLANLLIKSIGFFGIYLLCRKVFSFSFYWGLLAAILFTMNNGMTIHGNRIQLATIAFTPIMALLLWNASTALLDNNPQKFRKYGFSAAMLYGAWCLTCFYMAWFFTLFFAVFCVAAFIKAGRAGFSILLARISAFYGSIIFVAGSALASLLPFICAYLPKSHEVGVRSYEEVRQYLVQPLEILQVGQDNFMFGHLYHRLLSIVFPAYVPFGEYYDTGFAIGLFVLFICGCVHVLAKPSQTRGQIVLHAVVIAAFCTWLLVINFSGHSAWFFVYDLVPGAKALRVISAYQIFLALPVIIVAIDFLSMRRMALFMALPIIALLIAEELNEPRVFLDRNAELAHIALPQLPPAQCRVFYTSAWNNVYRMEGHFFAHNVTAMIIAQFAGIPTINGVASFNPPDWNFDFADKPDYDERVRNYAMKHGVAGLCRLDINSKQWSLVHDLEPDPMIQRKTISFKESAWPNVATTHGLSSTESWGTWSSGDRVSIEFTTPLPEKLNVRLVAQAFGSNIGKRFTAHVGNSAVDFTLSAIPEEKILKFDNRERSSILLFDVPSPISPKTLGQGEDARNLGIGFTELQAAPQ